MLQAACAHVEVVHFDDGAAAAIAQSVGIDALADQLENLDVMCQDWINSFHDWGRESEIKGRFSFRVVARGALPLLWGKEVRLRG